MFMRTLRTLTLTAATLGIVLGAANQARAQVRLDVSLTVFHDGLSGYGDWVRHDRYGDVWVPRQAHAWRPYSVGYWTYTDAGWTWVSDEPWAWATYHYGRWAFDPGFGWVWVPDTTWGPSWVAWRSNDDYTGWAPLPPGIEVSEDFDPPIDSFGFVFVRTRYLCEPRLVTYIEPQARNVTYVRLTTNATHFSVVSGVVINRGVRVENVERVVGHPVPRLTIQAVSGVQAARVSGGQVAIYRPPTVVIAAGAHVAAPIRSAHVETVAEMNARHVQEQRTLAADHERERVALEKQHSTELAHPPAGLSRQEIIARQETEHQAQAQNEARQKAVLDARHDREQHDNGRRGGK
jgi:hypothetical protein